MTKKHTAAPARGYYGPQLRPGAVQRCVCGLHFVDYNTHRETGYHKRAMREQRAKLRAAGLLVNPRGSGNRAA